MRNTRGFGDAEGVKAVNCGVVGSGVKSVTNRCLVAKEKIAKLKYLILVLCFHEIAGSGKGRPLQSPKDEGKV